MAHQLPDRPGRARGGADFAPGRGRSGGDPSLDDEHGEVPKALVVLKTAAAPEELMEFVAGRVASYKKVRRLAIVDAIPKPPTGKLLRRVLVEQIGRHCAERGGLLQ